MKVEQPITTDTRIEYVNLHDQRVIYDVPVCCGACTKCLLGRHGRCMYGGPFNADYQVSRGSFERL